MFTVETVINDIKELMSKYGAKEGTTACEIKFKDYPKLYKEAKIHIAKTLGIKEIQ